jgi:hypothetical protein
MLALRLASSSINTLDEYGIKTDKNFLWMSFDFNYIIILQLKMLFMLSFVNLTEPTCLKNCINKNFHSFEMFWSLSQLKLK